MNNREEKRYTIAIIDDDEIVRTRMEQYIIKFLEKNKINIETVFKNFKDAEEATVYFKNNGKADIIFLDIYMTNGENRDEHLNGDAFMKNLKALGLELPVIVITSEPHGDKESCDVKNRKLAEMKKLGIIHLVTKEEVFDIRDLNGNMEVFHTILKLSIKNYLNEKSFIENEIRLSNTKDRLKAMKSAVKMNFGYSVTDSNRIITEINDIFTRTSGYTKKYVIGGKHSILRSPRTEDGFIKNMIKTIESKRIWSGVVENINKSGKPYNIRTIISPIISSLTGEITGYINIFTDITDLYNQAKKDDLTGLYKRNVFYHEFHKHKEMYMKNENFESHILILDIDNFKKYNETYGHNFGDEVIKQISFIIKDSIRNNDIGIRWGGDEFIVMLNRANNKISADVAERIRHSIENIILKTESHQEVDITVSIGATVINFGNDNVEGIVARADNALYKAKEAGKNQVVFF